MKILNNILIIPKKITFYNQLYNAFKAGLSIYECFKNVSIIMPKSKFNSFIHMIKNGKSLENALNLYNSYFSEIEISMLKLAIDTGEWEKICLFLKEYFEFKKERLMVLLFQFAYPVFLLHMLIIIPEIPTLVINGLFTFIYKILKNLTILYVLFFTIFRLKSKIIEYLLNKPIIGIIIKNQEKTTLFQVLGITLNIGLPLNKIIDTLINISTFDEYKRKIKKLIYFINNGDSLSKALFNTGIITEEEYSIFNSAEISGNLAESFIYQKKLLNNKIKTQTKIFISIISIIVYFLVAGLIAIKIIGFYSNYFSFLK